jgi:DNA-binding transcriptional regulator YdaS (Cro superfamily)
MPVDVHQPAVYVSVHMDTPNPVEKACEILGSQRALAAACDVSPQAVTKWLENGVPAERVLTIERVTNGAVSRYSLRPDLYPKDDVA